MMRKALAAGSARHGIERGARMVYVCICIRWQHPWAAGLKTPSVFAAAVRLCDLGGAFLKLVLEWVQTRRTNVHPEHGATVALADLVAAVVVRGAGDEQLGTGKLHARDIARRQLDLAHNLALAVNLDDAALAVDGVPDVAVHVDAEAVDAAGALVLVEDALVGGGAGLCVKVVCQDVTSRGVCKVECLVVGRPADRVGNGKTGGELGLVSRAECEERSYKGS
jgi:hypothetical protein